MNVTVKIVLTINCLIPIWVGLNPIAGWIVPQIVSAHWIKYGNGKKDGNRPEKEKIATVTRLKLV